MNGRILCKKCKDIIENDPEYIASGGAAKILIRLSPTTLAALRYIESAPQKRFLSFSIPDDELELLGERRIVYSDLDYNMHMNNTRYADMLCDFMPLEDIPKIKGMSLSYLHEAALGDTVKVYTKKTDDRYSFRTVNQNGITCLEAEVLI